MAEDEFVAVCCDKPAIHRFPAVMGRRIHAMCVVLADRYGGQPERLWWDGEVRRRVLRRLRELPGYGEEKAQIFVALLAKRFGVRPPGWKQRRGVRRPAAANDRRLPRRSRWRDVREWKRVQREAKKDKQGRDLTQRAG